MLTQWTFVSLFCFVSDQTMAKNINLKNQARWKVQTYPNVKFINMEAGVNKISDSNSTLTPDKPLHKITANK